MSPQDVNPGQPQGDTPPTPPQQSESEYQLAPSLMQSGENGQPAGSANAVPQPPEAPPAPGPAPFDSQQFQQQPVPQPGSQFGSQFNAQPGQGFGGMPPGPAMPGGPMPGAMPMMPNQMQLNQAYGHDKLAIASLVIGVISLPASILNFLALPIPILGLVFGFISLKRNKGLALGGIILSSIGFILSILVLVVGLHLRSQAGSHSSLSSSSASAGTVDTDCFNFQLPSYYTMSDVQKKGACSVVIINSSSTDDISISSLPLPSGAVSDSDKQAVLKTYMDKFTEAGGSQLHVGAATLTTFAGSPAYEASGTEDSSTYKYASGATILAPRPYDADGESDQVFIVATDSATATDRIQSLEKSFNWK